ncbi:MAG: type I restriction-modification system subunit M N-terminal domain-containing protein [Desulfobacteraceae bacterium]
MNDQQKRDIIFNKVWQACDTFRGVIDPGSYKDYILTMLFLKYLSDIHKSKRKMSFRPPTTASMSAATDPTSAS